jgi:hypothetical protein
MLTWGLSVLRAIWQTSSAAVGAWVSGPLLPSLCVALLLWMFLAVQTYVRGHWRRRLLLLWVLLALAGLPLFGVRRWLAYLLWTLGLAGLAARGSRSGSTSSTLTNPDEPT